MRSVYSKSDSQLLSCILSLGYAWVSVLAEVEVSFVMTKVFVIPVISISCLPRLTFC